MVKLSEGEWLNLTQEISSRAKEYKYQLREWDVWVIYRKFTDNTYNENWLNEIFIPTYQRNLTWDNKRKSRFIESLFLNLPIPFVFLNKSNEEDSIFDSDIHEVIDWSQRIRTIVEFKENAFRLQWLEDLEWLKGLKYKDLPVPLQRRFDLIPFRTVIFEGLSEEKRKDMFNRINTSSDALRWMEVRKWSFDGTFYTMLKELSESEMFNKLCPLSPNKKLREEGTELILRFFAYSERFDEYSSYNWAVQKMLDKYMKDKSEEIKNIETEIKSTIDEIEKEKLINELDDKINSFKYKFNSTLEIVEKFFPYWFKKNKEASVAWSRTLFESISVWVCLAIKEGGELTYLQEVEGLLNSFQYRAAISSDWANASRKFYTRINIMKDFLLEWPIILDEYEPAWN